MELIILQPDRTIFKGEVDSVNLPGKHGRFSVHAGHAPLISLLKAGTIYYKISGEGADESVLISEGFAKVKQDIIQVCIE